VGGPGQKLRLSPVKAAWAIHQLVNVHLATVWRSLGIPW
jgi:hypothetical protein